MGTEIQKSKVAIVNQADEILVLVRSDKEDTRQGGLDWPGGKFEPGETDPVQVLLRESSQELPGTQLRNIMPLDRRPKIKAGVLVISHLFAAKAQFPNGEENIELSFEHSDSMWVPRREFHALDIPLKYKRAVALYALIFDRLLELDSGDTRPEMRMAMSA